MGDGMFFDRVAAVYDEARPPYPPALYERLRKLDVLRSGVRVLEVGAGTGQATEAFVSAGARVVALEPAPAMASRLRRRFRGVDTMVCRLEDAELPHQSFDAAISATAFHWVDPAGGLPKIHGALVPEGMLSVWRTVFGDAAIQTPFRQRVAEITARRPIPPMPRADPLAVDDWMVTLTAGGLFAPIETGRFDWSIHLSTEQVRALFGTFSDWSPSEVDGAAAIVESLGGSVTEHYVTVLCVCRAIDVG